MLKTVVKVGSLDQQHWQYLLEMPIFGLYSRPTDSDTLELGSSNLGDLMVLKFENYWYGEVDGYGS